MTDVLVLCYHAISPDWDAALSVTPRALEAQLTTLVDRGWRGSTFSEAVLQPARDRTLVVTFDDGFLSVLERAEPILTKLGLPATVFVPTSFMAERQPLLWPGVERWADTPFASELQGMSWDDLRALTELGWEIGSHTSTHLHLTRLDDQTAMTELEKSRSQCEHHLDRTCTSVAYPYGDVDERISGLARTAGYEAGACLSSSLALGGPLRWPRVGVYHDDAGWRFWLKASTAMRRLRASRVWPEHE